MVTINVFAMIFASLVLIWMLMRTRCQDTPGWWAFRVLISYTLICFVYLAYDTNNVGDALPTRYLFIRLGWVSLVIAMALSWHLMRTKVANSKSSDFTTRLKNIFNLGE